MLHLTFVFVAVVLLLASPTWGIIPPSLKSNAGPFIPSRSPSSPPVFLSSYLSTPSEVNTVSSVSFPVRVFPEIESFLSSSRPSPDMRTNKLISSLVESNRLVKSPDGLLLTLGYSGFITVNATYNSNMFFWFIPSLDGNVSAPLIVWVNGGPGATSMYGLFEELGPFYSDANGDFLYLRTTTWNWHANIVYLDNPVGVGFSFTDNVKGYVTDQTAIGNNFYSFITQFMQLFPVYAGNEFGISGESYGGKYATTFGTVIDSHNEEVRRGRGEKAKGKGKVGKSEVGIIDLRYISIGDGIISPIDQIPGYSTLLFEEGMLDPIEYDYFSSVESNIVTLLNNNEYVPAFRLFDALINGDFFPYPTSYTNFTGLTDYFNIRQPDYPPNNWMAFINKDWVRSIIHVGDTPFWSQNNTVEFYLLNDWFHSVKLHLPHLIETYNVLIYNGGFDVILSAPQCENMLDNLDWSFGPQWRNASKEIWKIHSNDTVPAGYAKEYDNFHYVIVREAGHLLPQDQPDRAYDMFTRFITGRGFKD